MPDVSQVVAAARATRQRLLLISGLRSGGAERVCVLLANAWAAADCEVSVVTLLGEDTDFYELDPRITRIVLTSPENGLTFFARLTRSLSWIGSLRSVLGAARPCIVISFMDRSNVLLALAGVGRDRVVCIGTEHTHPPSVDVGPLWSVLRRICYRFLWAVVALTEESARWLSTHTGARRTPVIPNPANWPVPDNDPYLPPPPKRTGRLLCVGRLESHKGFDLALSCFAKLAGQFPDWDLAIVGEGSQRDELKSQVARLHIGAQVHMPGLVGNIRDWYESADIFVMPSHFEGFPMTLLEAMAHGLPAVSFDCRTGPREIIRDGVDGLLVPAGDVEKLRVALYLLMTDDEQRADLAERALEVRSRFSMETISKMWESLFSEALNATHSWPS